MTSISVGRRLSLLVLSELVIAAAFVVTAMVALERLSDQASFVHRYVSAPLFDIGEAFVTANDLTSSVEQGPAGAEHSKRSLAQLRVFIDRYHREWEVFGSSLPDATRFRKDLERARRLPLVGEEKVAVNNYLVHLESLERGADRPEGLTPLALRDVISLRSSLIELNHVNLKYLEIGYDSYGQNVRALMTLFIVIGLASMIVSPTIGLAVRRAIAPRVALLVDKVQRFRELGVNQPVGPWKGDELAVLANALDVSFAAIAGRDKDRARFLAVAAHELKTPLTTLKGFAQAALTNRGNQALLERALTVIDRQSTRLARLMEDLLSVASVEGGRLRFRPGPLDLEALTRGAIAEVEILTKEHTFPLQVHGDVHILGDASLLEQSISSLLIEAATMVPAGTPVRVTIDGAGAVVNLRVEARGVDIPESRLDSLTEPFGTLQFEGRERGDVRSTGVGLYLAREVAKLHAASLQIDRVSAELVVFVHEFRR